MSDDSSILYDELSFPTPPSSFVRYCSNCENTCEQPLEGYCLFFHPNNSKLYILNKLYRLSLLDVWFTITSTRTGILPLLIRKYNFIPFNNFAFNLNFIDSNKCTTG